MSQGLEPSTYSTYITTNQVCPNAKWKDAIFIGEPLPETDFKIFNDNFNFISYIKHISKQNIISFSFLLLILIFIFIFILWRIIRIICVLCCCMRSCDKKRRKNKNLLLKKKYILLKCMIILSAVSLSILAMYGAINLKFSISTEIWQIVIKIKDFIDEVYFFGNGIVNGITDIKSNINQVNNILIHEIASNETNYNSECTQDFFEIKLNSTNELENKLLTLDSELEKEATNEEFQVCQDKLTYLNNSLIEPSSIITSNMTLTNKTLIHTQYQISSLLTTINLLSNNYDDNEISLASVDALDSARASLEDMSTIASDLRYLNSELMSFNVNISIIDDLITMLDDTDIVISNIIISFNHSYLELDSFNHYLYHGYQCLNNLLTKLIITNETYIKVPDYIFDDLTFAFEFEEILQNYFESDDLNLFEIEDKLYVILFQLLNLNQLLIPDLNLYLLDLKNELNTIEVLLNSDISIDLDNLAGYFDTAQNKLNDVNDSISLFQSSPSQTSYTSLFNIASFDLKPNIELLEDSISAFLTKYENLFLNSNNIFNLTSYISLNIQDFYQSNEELILNMDNVVNVTQLIYSINEITIIHSFVVDLYLNNTEMFYSVKSYLFDLSSSISEELELIIDSLDSIALSVSDELNDTHSHIINNINKLENDIKEKAFKYFLDETDNLPFVLLSDKVNDDLYIIIICLYLASIVFVVLLCIFVLVNCQFGIIWILLLFMFLILIYFVIVSMNSSFLIITNDFCANMEGLILEKTVNEDFHSLITYYINGSDSGENVTMILESEFDITFQEIEDIASLTKNEILQISDLWEIRNELNNIFMEIIVTIDKLLLDVNSLDKILGYNKVNILFKEIKNLVCCIIPNILYEIWKILIYSGAIGLSLLIFGSIILNVIDKLPRLDCCGCHCHRYKNKDLEDCSDNDSVKSTKLPDTARTHVSDLLNSTDVV